MNALDDAWTLTCPCAYACRPQTRLYLEKRSVDVGDAKEVWERRTPSASAFFCRWFDTHEACESVSVADSAACGGLLHGDDCGWMGDKQSSSEKS